MINKTFYSSKIFFWFELNIFFLQLLILKPKTVIFLFECFVFDEEHLYLSLHIFHWQKIGRKSLYGLFEDMLLVSTSIKAEILAIQDLFKAIDQLKVLRYSTYLVLNPDLFRKLSPKIDIHILYCINRGEDLRTNNLKHG